MLRRLAGTTALDIMIVQFLKEKLVIMALYRSPLTVTLWPSSFLKKDSTSPKSAPNSQFSGCKGVSIYTCGLASLQMRQFCLLT
ncbi:hypothetical protein TNCV_1235001 [Trichonephila clavipes]|nr:hypothetical protein TNCV_1235001 [Trichonephila clavipes]